MGQYPIFKGGTEMDRREFLRYSFISGALLVAGDLSSWAEALGSTSLRVIDAHAHPDRYIADPRQSQDPTSTLKSIKALGMAASAFAAVGDTVFLSQGRVPGTEFYSTKTQLEWWEKGVVKKGEVKLVLKASDVPPVSGPDNAPGAIFAIEGGDALAGKPERVNEFYHMGVRMITLIHYRNNELGDIMRMFRNLDPGRMNNGLTSAGRKVAERMQELGMVVDVAHAHSNTLTGIAEMSARPLVDSHTSLCPFEDPSRCGRLRTWNDIELIAKTGGVVCTWPLAYKLGDHFRMTFLDWAKEILEMKNRLGMEHVGLGTDGGGSLPQLIEGYRDVRDLSKLAAAMREIGLSGDDVTAYMGGNFNRVLQQCLR
jgi:membrane dipeptidase